MDHAFETLLAIYTTPAHGYGIISDVRNRTNGDVVIGTSSLYAIIRRLLRDDLIEDAGDMPAAETKGPPRRYYRITESGRQYVQQEARRMRRAVEAAETILSNPLAQGSATEDR